MQQATKDPVIRVVLVEDDVNFQNALADAIGSAPDMMLLHIANTRSQGLQMLDQNQPDVLLVDLGLPDGSGIDVIRAAHVKWPACSIMVCTTFGDETHVMKSIEAGASGYLLKNSTQERLVLEIRSLYAGGSPISPLIARQILMRFRQVEVPTIAVTNRRSVVLSAREKEVLEYIVKGFTDNEISSLIQVSRHTVLTYVRRIYAKLEVNSKMEAVYAARNQGLLND